jgi:hypothetical protein
MMNGGILLLPEWSRQPIGEHKSRLKDSRIGMLIALSASGPYSFRGRRPVGTDRSFSEQERLGTLPTRCRECRGPPRYLASHHENQFAPPRGHARWLDLWRPHR